MLKLLLNNKHTSAAAVVYVLAKLGAQLGAVWIPQHKDQFDTTANLVESAAVAYGLLAAGDAVKSASKAEVAQAIDTGDTSTLKKSETKP